MHWKNRFILLVGIVIFLMVFVPACSANGDKPILAPEASKDEIIEETGSGHKTEPVEKPSIQETEEEDIDGPGGMTPIGPKSEPLFNMCTLPSDWPRLVPLMTEFQVTIYKWTDDVMYAAGYGDVNMSRATNYYTNAQKIHVSSNI